MNEPTVEIDISPMPKLRAKALIFDLISTSGIQDESDLNEIEYRTLENSKQISQCLIKFKTLEG